MPILNPDIETMDRRELLDLQMERLQIVVNQAYSKVDFYRKKFDEAGVIPDDIKTLDDLKRIPFTTRKDLIDNYPYGMFAVPLRDVVQLQFPLGMYGNPIVIGYTREDLRIWREVVARVMVAGMVTRGCSQLGRGSGGCHLLGDTTDWAVKIGEAERRLHRREKSIA
jgi:phenylacetate-CoA ligase